MSERPFQPRPVVIVGKREHQLLRRVMRVNGDERYIESLVLIEEADRYVALVDTGHGTGRTTSARDTALHVIWARDEATAAIAVEGHGALTVAPGDTISVAAGVGWTNGPGLIVCEVGGPESSSRPGRVAGPTHGLETFDGYNRRTLCALTPGFSLERWKITQPLEIPGNAAIVNLVEPMALVWPGGTDLVGRGEARIVTQGIEQVTLLPDGLGYALVVRAHPDVAALAHVFGVEAIPEVAL